MKSYRRKYIFSLIAILILILSGLVYAILHIMKTNAFSLQEKNLTREGVLIAHIVEDKGLTRTSIQEINELTRELGLYTAVIRDDGIFLYENGLISDTGHLELRKWLSETLPKKNRVEDVRIYESSHYLFLKKPLHEEDDKVFYLLVGTPVASDARVMKNLFAVGSLFFSSAALH